MIFRLPVEIIKDDLIHGEVIETKYVNINRNFVVSSEKDSENENNTVLYLSDGRAEVVQVSERIINELIFPDRTLIKANV